MKLRIFLLGIFLILFSTTSYTVPSDSKQFVKENSLEQLESFGIELYESFDKDSNKPAFNVFQNAIIGFFKLKASNVLENSLLTVIDFSLPSTQERLWVIDMIERKIIYRTLVAHGQNSGNLYADNFSNTPSSHQSSLGFYLTGKVYSGKHGISLRLDGVEQGINDKARERAIVMHSADYVSYDFINKHGRLGRSHGCPAIPMENHEEVIRTLAGKSCMYIYHSMPDYHSKTHLKADEESLIALIRFLKEQSSYTAIN